MSVYASSSCQVHERVCNLLSDTRSENLVYILSVLREGRTRYIISRVRCTITRRQYSRVQGAANNPRRERFHGLWDLDDMTASSDEGADGHGDTASSSIIPDMRLTMDSGYCRSCTRLMRAIA